MKVVVAYSGDQGGGAAIRALADHGRAEVVTVTVDVGQKETLEDVRERALTLGAARAHVVDGREDFVRDCLWPALAGGALRHRLSAGVELSHLLVAQHLVAIAALEEADAVAHGATSASAADRFERALADLNGALVVLAPAREHSGTMPSGSSNLWQWPSIDGLRSGASGLRARIDVDFDAGRPAAINGVVLDPVDLVAAVGTISGLHGVGRVVAAADPVPCDAPAAPVLVAAHTALCRHVWPPALLDAAGHIGSRYAALITTGEWFGLTRLACDAFAGQAQRGVTGTVTVEVEAGCCEVVGVRESRPIAAVASAAPSRKDS